MNYSKFVKEMERSEIARQFGIKKIRLSARMPICRYKSMNHLPKDTFLEEYHRLIITRETGVVKKSFRLKYNNNTLFSNWKFPFTPKTYKIYKKWLYVKIPKKYICLSFDKKSINKKHSIILPRRIELSPDDFVAIGLLKGEMISSTRGKSRHYLSFTNSEPLLINTVMKFLERLGISKSDVSFQVIVNTLNNQKRSCRQYISHWSKKLNVSKKLFVKPYFDRRYRTRHELGAVSLKYYNTHFRLFLQFLVDYAFDNASKSNSYCLLKGLLATEGSIHLSPNNSLVYISIGVSEQKNVTLYTHTLNRCGILPGCYIKGVSDDKAKKRGWKKGTGGFMVIQGWNNFRIAHLNNLFEFSPNKKLRFLYGLVHHRETRNDCLFEVISQDFSGSKEKEPHAYNDILRQRNRITKKEEKVLYLIKKCGYITRNHLSDSLGILPSSASRRLKSMQRKGYVKRSNVAGNILWYVT